MILTLKRERCAGLYTEGKLYIDGVYFCDTIEDPVRKVKVPGETAIPAGVYYVIMTMSSRFKKIMPVLLDVPGFSGVRIHAGNTANDSEGCILVGVKLTAGMITKSRETRDKLYAIIAEAIKKGETVEIEII